MTIKHKFTWLCWGKTQPDFNNWQIYQPRYIQSNWAKFQFSTSSCLNYISFIINQLSKTKGTSNILIIITFFQDANYIIEKNFT